jgi:nucleoside-diphosphate-sugar epimerase
MSLTTKQSILLTGGTGFIGSSLANFLAKNFWEVHLIVRPQSPKLYPLNSNIRFHIYNENIDSLKQAIILSNPKAIIHLATHFIAEHSAEDIHKLITANIEFGTQLLEACRLREENKLITTGTSWENFSNNDSYDPSCLYAATKRAFDDICAYYYSAHNFQFIKLKLFDTYGGNDQRKKLLPLLKNQTSNNIDLLMSPGNQSIDLLYIDDVVNGFNHALNLILGTKSERPIEYLINSGQSISIRSLVELITKLTGRKFKVQWGANPYRKREIMGPNYFGKQLPGWSPQISLEDGLCNYFEMKR